jgi:transcriptional regulator NrdR family protein
MRCIKRNGDVVAFDPQRIINAMRKAFNAEGVRVDDTTLQMLETQVEGDFQNRVK